MFAIAALLLVALFGATYETTYTDASGAHCAAFGIGDREIDFCHGSFSR